MLNHISQISTKLSNQMFQPTLLTLAISQPHTSIYSWTVTRVLGKTLASISQLFEEQKIASSSCCTKLTNYLHLSSLPHQNVLQRQH